ncbi:MAG: hypothetical protein ACRES2_06540, partial [Steroidobacteraceae bacterium]
RQLGSQVSKFKVGDLAAVGVLPKQSRPDDVSRALLPLRLLGDPLPEGTVRAARTPAPAAAATEADSTASAGIATPIGMTPELRAQFDALLRDHGVELRQFVAASLAQHSGQIIGEVRALMAGAEPSASAPAPAPPLPAPVARPLHGGTAALWLAVAAALIAVAAGIFWYRAQLLAAGIAVATAHARAHAAVPAAADATTAAAIAPAAASAETRLLESVPFGEQPLGGSRVETVRALLEQLATSGFRGAVEIRSYPGRFCMQASGASPQLPAADVAYATCSSVGNPLDYAEPRSLQSPEFAALLAAQASRGRGALDVQLVIGSADDVATPYPAISAPLSAGEWNRAAAANNRIEVRTRSIP